MRPTLTSTRRRRRVLGSSLAGALVGALALGGLGISALPAAAAPDARTVVSGDARFQVLSPTLIRTEYAGDAQFIDQGTFNVIGRDDFAATPFTQTRADGWLTLSTGKMTVKYREGSGDFTQDNLQVDLTTSTGQAVTGSPWVTAETPVCTIGTLCEGEALQLQGLASAKDHAGYTGSGFAAGFENVGNSMTFATTVQQAGSYDLAMRYANNRGGDGQLETRILSIVVDGGAPVTLRLPAGESWDEWKQTTAALDLTAGKHTIRIERSASDSGRVNVDSLAVVPSGAGYPTPTPATAGQDCAFGAVCEAEDAGKAGNAQTAADHNGFSGDGFASGLWGGADSALTTHVTGVPTAGDYALQVRYANGTANSPELTVAPAGQEATTGALAPTSGWDYWNTVTIPVHLAAGANDVTLGCPTVDNNCNVNIDTIAVVDQSSPLLAAHAPLGGYRRDLDTANGSVKTNPGLLYQDGWSLLDDTASALYDTATEQTTPRGDHGGEGYQDGYVFGYGTEYTTALKDLATLTGPSKLLPRWAYGVWYSEYYDRSQEDYLAIAKRFKDEGVPVDVMAIDTDYKTGSTTNQGDSKWNGWSVDPSRIPDMTALLADWHEQGIHNTLNIHPSISGNDPEFAKAQATAKGKLTKGDGDRYLFDWSDPDQLKAYFELHDTLQPEGVDMWWLDWCCSENSKYSANGVTPDAFINQQYAEYTDEQLKGRGLAFSRAYGSLTAGGYGNPQAVPTGPWADKRTTLHFTGDTTSTWQELAAQVGYTPGESAATGLSAISHDIGGHNGGQYGIEGAEPGTTQLPPDLYARWVQFGAFQPIDRLHSNHSDRLPWQYPAEANASAKQFLNLREDLLPLTYTLAADASRTGTPMLQPLYLQYPEAQESYAQAGKEYLYGKDVLVAPVTSGGSTATTSVWFPAGDTWTDWFTGKTYEGGTTADVTTDLTTMPVFVRSGGIVPTRSHHVANDAAPLDAVTVTVATGADGSFALHEDSGEGQPTAAADTSARAAGNSASTAMRFTQQATGGTLDISPVDGSFDGQVQDRSWTATFTNAERPQSVTIDGAPVAASEWTYDADSRTLTVPIAERSVTDRTVVRYSTLAAAVPSLQVEDQRVTAGDTQTVTGTGFPADATVTLATTPELGDDVTVRTAADGSFTAELAVPATAAAGRVAVTASVGGVVLARAAFTVVAAAPTASPSPTPAPGDGPGAGGPGTGGPGAGAPGAGGSGADGSGAGGSGAGGSGAQPVGDQPGGSGADRDGALAWTGANVVPIGILAVVLLAAGGLLLTQRMRRRRAE
ncbi:glycoside hydrolase family 31 protein [Curtobacterium sp. MCPF17_050]|uniref:TIM-barrel domain-containing protein n=1 Tax=Curtobacterium sp. MCPF17_050 TaxID=2175664 RepID=UPI001C64BFDA|nr:TIM-barrel domain-containing protein [Curtobacterium sp. MCPF17_050]WIB16053.1 glycoside hydrolase family 31 protein [Curtobacterium sp. MCPF17_050]